MPKSGSRGAFRRIADRNIQWREKRVRIAQESMRKNPYKLPTILLLAISILMTIAAWLVSTQRDLDLSWQFLLTLAIAFCYGLAIGIELKNRRTNTRWSYYYVGLGFLVQGALYGTLRDATWGPQVVIGWSLGWFYGAITEGVLLWRRFRKSKRADI